MNSNQTNSWILQVLTSTRLSVPFLNEVRAESVRVVHNQIGLFIIVENLVLCND
jgi:lipid-A-disaccharide synthase-like uncharacterized protein